MSKGKKRIENEQKKADRLKEDLKKNKGMSKFQLKGMARRMADFQPQQTEA